MVAKHKCKEHDSDPNKHTRWKPQSRLCVGQDSLGLGWEQRMEHQKKKMSEFGGQEGLCELFDDEREALGGTQTQDWRERA